MGSTILLLISIRFIIIIIYTFIVRCSLLKKKKIKSTRLCFNLNDTNIYILLLICFVLNNNNNKKTLIIIKIIKILCNVNINIRLLILIQ